MTSSMKSESRSILVVAPNWLGDAVMSLPLLGYLSGLDHTRLTVLTQGYTTRVFWGLQTVDQLLVMAKDGPMRRLWSRCRTLRSLRFDGAVLLPPSFSSALTAFLGGVPHRVGFAGDVRGVLLSKALPGGGLRDEHLSENYLRLGRAWSARRGLTGPADVTTPRLQVFDREREALLETMTSLGAPATDYVVVVPGAMFGDTKRWPLPKYRKLVARLCVDMPVVLSGGRGERQLCAVVADGLKGVYNLAGLTDLGQFFALLQGARVLVANDSGAPHAAASLGTPAVVIFGSTSPTWTRPLGDSVHVVRQPVDCSPCFLDKCPTQLECYEGISPDVVCNAVMSAMAAEPSRTGARHR